MTGVEVRWLAVCGLLIGLGVGLAWAGRGRGRVCRPATPRHRPGRGILAADDDRFDIFTPADDAVAPQHWEWLH